MFSLCCSCSYGSFGPYCFLDVYVHYSFSFLFCCMFWGYLFNQETMCTSTVQQLPGHLCDCILLRDLFPNFLHFESSFSVNEHQHRIGIYFQKQVAKKNRTQHQSQRYGNLGRKSLDNRCTFLRALCVRITICRIECGYNLFRKSLPFCKRI